jgi:uncharacterized DUF497 family protein
MKFAWDGSKSERNFLTRGFGFDFAALIFSGLVIEAPDSRQDYGEVRIRAIGQTQGFVLLVVYTDRGDTRRIISARLVNKKERALWQLFAKL